MQNKQKNKRKRNSELMQNKLKTNKNQMQDEFKAKAKQMQNNEYKFKTNVKQTQNKGKTNTKQTCMNPWVQLNDMLALSAPRQGNGASRRPVSLYFTLIIYCVSWLR